MQKLKFCHIFPPCSVDSIVAFYPILIGILAGDVPFMKCGNWQYGGYLLSLTTTFLVIIYDYLIIRFAQLKPHLWHTTNITLSHSNVQLHHKTSRVSWQKGPTRHAYAWQIGHFWQDTLDIWKEENIRKVIKFHSRHRFSIVLLLHF